MTTSSRTHPFHFERRTVELLREALLAAGFDEQSLVTAIGARSISTIAEVPGAVALRRVESDAPLHVLVRLFVIGAAVDEASARRALAPARLEKLVAARLLSSRGGRVVAQLKITPISGLLLGFDRTAPGETTEASDFVMGPSDSGRSLANVMLRGEGFECLDLGAGCGYLSLLAARHAKHVVATDVNARAGAFVELNKVLNATPNVEFVAGSLFEPVRGRSFDFVFSNPPFVISPDHQHVYMSSGMKGDSFCRRIVAEAPSVLKKGGWLQLLANWGERDDGAWTGHLESWFEGGGYGAWVLRHASHQPRDYAVRWISEDREDRARFEAHVEAWLAYYAAEGIDAIGAGVITARREARPWFRAFDGPPTLLGPGHAVLSDRVNALSRMQALSSDDALLGAVLECSSHARLTRECEPIAGGWKQTTATVSLAEGIPFSQAIDPYVGELVVACDGARTVREAIAFVLDRLGAPGREPAGTLDVLRQLVDEGFLTPRS